MFHVLNYEISTSIWVISPLLPYPQTGVDTGKISLSFVISFVFFQFQIQTAGEINLNSDQLQTLCLTQLNLFHLYKMNKNPNSISFASFYNPLNKVQNYVPLTNRLLFAILHPKWRENIEILSSVFIFNNISFILT